MDELSIIDRFFRPLAGEGSFGLFDDAARLAVPPGCELVVTTDMIASGVHFLADDPAGTIAQKALRVNLSDLAAKGAKPVAYVLGVGLSDAIDAAWLSAFADGLRHDQERFGIELLGGDTIAVEGGPVISVTAFGAVPSGRMVHRFGGKPGDALYVSGAIGLGTVGLALLKGKAGAWDSLSAERRLAFVQRYRVPEPRLGLAPALVAHASAAMDISDGLVGDCDKLAAASGCSAVIEAESVPLPDGLIGSRSEGELAALLTGGDDYEILAAVPSGNELEFRRAAEGAGIPVARIGNLVAGSGPTRLMLGGQAMALKKRAFVHGRRNKHD